jgi:hypothetical protein
MSGSDCFVTSGLELVHYHNCVLHLRALSVTISSYIEGIQIAMLSLGGRLRSNFAGQTYVPGARYEPAPGVRVNGQLFLS